MARHRAMPRMRYPGSRSPSAAIETGENWISAGGRAFRLDPADPLARAEWLAVGEIQGSAAGARILSAVAIDESDVMAAAAGRIAERKTVRWRKDLGGIEALRERTLGAIRLSSGTDDKPDRAGDRQRAGRRAAQRGPWPAAVGKSGRRAPHTRRVCGRGR